MTTKGRIMLDVDFIRSLYTACTDGVYRDHAFFENAGGSYIPRPVLDPFIEFLREYKVQPYAPYAMAQRAGAAMDAGYAAVAELLNADPDEITIGPSTTLNTYVLAQAIRSSIAEGDEIVVTNQDHEANIGCWRRLEKSGAVIREWRVDPETGQLDIADLERLLSGRTRLVCFTLCSNIVGTFHDVRRITALARDAGALSMGDGVSFAPHRLLDVRDSGLDFYCFSTYKTFAPHTGVMWGRRESLERLEPQGHYFNNDLPRYRFNPAGPLHAEIAALGGLRDYIEQIHARHFDGGAGLRDKAEAVFDLFARHEQALAKQLLDYLGARPDVRIIGHRDAVDGRRASTIAFTCSSMPSRDVVTRLAERKIGCSHGHFYARRCIEALGIDPADGVVRVSMVHYNTPGEVERLVRALDEIL
ncbi:MAG: aminotransferase class V-fold PLP-dependent enzyme [Proteobacteria bacterium]|nr:MAG: aminotransferase class V-fold PLP-dependent enzyme [Pseudomonadota bacterium]